MTDTAKTPTFEEVKGRLAFIAEEVSREDLPLDDALALYEEAVGLGLAACDASEDVFGGGEQEDAGADGQ